VAAFGILVGAP